MIDTVEGDAVGWISARFEPTIVTRIEQTGLGSHHPLIELPNPFLHLVFKLFN
jgi:hypothetical protein